MCLNSASGWLSRLSPGIKSSCTIAHFKAQKELYATAIRTFHSNIVKRNEYQQDSRSRLASANNKNEPQQNDRIHKLIARSRTLSKLNEIPRFKRYFDQLSQTSAVSTITSFLVLHEITAIVPLFSLWWVVYQLNLGHELALPVYFTDLLNRCGEAMERLVGDHYTGFDRSRLVLSGAISYAIVKMLYPVRVFLSLWAAPYFTKWALTPFIKVRKAIKAKKTAGEQSTKQ
ncbi:LAMI_0H02124g1_1 [Lachancea mirantina]|uniref:LAMI_0H02124g1_1 n=1 Tax=Lachancea mirantina TaxID=1230905 RepID=A0A1G4KDW9_9SACH|nr:LAMI_0H02124g1_1 [Lachancea mirantina]